MPRLFLTLLPARSTHGTLTLAISAPGRPAAACLIRYDLEPHGVSRCVSKSLAPGAQAMRPRRTCRHLKRSLRPKKSRLDQLVAVRLQAVRRSGGIRGRSAGLRE